jgi:hypothetical protein
MEPWCNFCSGNVAFGGGYFLERSGDKKGREFSPLFSFSWGTPSISPDKRDSFSGSYVLGSSGVQAALILSLEIMG